MSILERGSLSHLGMQDIILGSSLLTAVFCNEERCHPADFGPQTDGRDGDNMNLTKQADICYNVNDYIVIVYIVNFTRLRAISSLPPASTE